MAQHAQLGLFPSNTAAPVIFKLGLGVDSVAMLIGLWRRAARPDLVIFANTGGEKPETIAYLDVINPWLDAVGFPRVHVVTRPVGRAGYTSLEENCLANETLPSLAFGKKSCSLKWKAETMDHFLLGASRGPNQCAGWPPVIEAIRNGLKPTKLIGYDAGARDSRRAVNRIEDEHFVYRYPLREWGWDRDRCKQEIASAGLPIPMKSACFFCPASQEHELQWLAQTHPDLFTRSIAMEDRARDGRHGLSAVKGLWGRKARTGAAGDGSWRSWAEAHGLHDLLPPKRSTPSTSKPLRIVDDSDDCGDTIGAPSCPL